jgi:hypothetical protein
VRFGVGLGGVDRGVCRGGGGGGVKGACWVERTSVVGVGIVGPDYPLNWTLHAAQQVPSDSTNCRADCC